MIGQDTIPRVYRWEQVNPTQGVSTIPPGARDLCSLCWRAGQKLIYGGAVIDSKRVEKGGVYIVSNRGDADHITRTQANVIVSTLLNIDPSRFARGFNGIAYFDLEKSQVVENYYGYGEVDEPFRLGTMVHLVDKEGELWDNCSLMGSFHFVRKLGIPQITLAREGDPKATAQRLINLL